MADLMTNATRQGQSERYVATRSLTESLASPLSPEDQTVQSMPDVSPTKWHRAHTTWFFETFLVAPNLEGFRPFHPLFSYLFNSYYEEVGDRYPRHRRGHVSRPGVEEIGTYRAVIDDAMATLLDGPAADPLAALVELGIQHEQQHQELLLMDIKHVLSRSPLLPAYSDVSPPDRGDAGPTSWTEYPGGIGLVGHEGSGFGFDNEFPRHRTFLEPFGIANQPVTCGEWSAFMDDGGYRRPDLWLSDGWATVQSEGWDSPLYWSRDGGTWQEFTLGGSTEVDPSRPVCHVSYYEADAFTRWAGFRLPTEAEWEVASESRRTDGNLLDLAALHPLPVTGGDDQTSLLGDVWQWTSSDYAPYPGFTPAPGAVGEYNGKFMVNQHVLRGGSCVTPQGHVRTSYRNFFPPAARWAFSGVRMARSY